METFWGYLGWTIVATAGFGYLWLAYRVVLFPKTTLPSVTHEVEDQDLRRAA